MVVEWWEDYEPIPGIRFIIDLDGFSVKGESSTPKFFAKELGVIDTDDNTVYLYHFKTKSALYIAKRQDISTINYATYKIHGLGVKDDRYDDLNQEAYHEIIGALAEEAQAQGKAIAYKGGTYERDAIRRAGFSNYLNLEGLNVPKFDKILSDDRAYFNDQFLKKYSCRRHIYMEDKNKTPHCSAAEVKAFQMFLLRRRR